MTPVWVLQRLETPLQIAGTGKQQTIFWPLTSGCSYLLFLLFEAVFLTFLIKLYIFSSLLQRHHPGES